MNEGATVRPRYGVRQPAMYHLFETEMQSISSFNSEALRWFAIGTFIFQTVVGVALDWIFETAPLSDFVKRLLPVIVTILVLITIVCYAFGVWAVWQRKKLVDQIKAETKLEADVEATPDAKV